MIVKELIKKLSQYPEEMDVFIAERETGFAYGLINSVNKKKINFMESPGGEILSSDDVIVISEV